MNPDMKGWKTYLLWEGLPFLMLFFVFGLISAINWDYEGKLITPRIMDDSASNWTDVHLGLILLAFATVLAFVASFLLFIVRIVTRVARLNLSKGWFMFASLILISILFIFPGLFIVILGPAAITMIEQTRVAPR